MIRFFAPVAIGLFFALSVLWSFGNGAVNAITDPAAPTVEHEFHTEPKALHLSSDGPFGKFDRAQLQRGFQVYNEVCKACHTLGHVAFRDLEQLGYSEAEVKAIAKQYKIPHYNAKTGEVTTADGLPTDHFPPVAYAGQGNPPDLSLIAKAREGHGAYVYSLLTGYSNAATFKNEDGKSLKAEFPDFETPAGLYFNPYFANLNIAMPPPLATGR